MIIMLRIYLRKLEAFTGKNKRMESIYVAHLHIGYKKNPNIKNTLIVDENVRDIVKKIFNMYANGYSSNEIVSNLNFNKYLSPNGYRKTGKVQDETNFKWNEVTICNMLKNEVYIGNTVQNKKSVVSYKVKKIRTVEEKNQIRVNNTHEAIIDKDKFEKVQRILQKRGTDSKFKYEYLLRGLLYCHHCKRKLQIVLKNSKRNAKTYPYITCSGHKQRGCYPLNINYNKFEDNIINIVKRICKIYLIHEEHKGKTKEEKELDELIESFLKLKRTNKIHLHRLIDKIEIDKNKSAYIYFNFSKLNSINDKLDEFIL